MLVTRKNRSTKRQRLIHVGDRRFVRGGVRQVFLVRKLSATCVFAVTTTEGLTDHFGKRSVMTEGHRMQLTELQLHAPNQFVEAQAPKKPVEVLFVALKSPTDRLFEA